MAQHYTEIIGIIFLLIFAATMFYQGTMIYMGKNGYKHCAREQKKFEDTRRIVEELLKDK